MTSWLFASAALAEANGVDRIGAYASKIFRLSQINCCCLYVTIWRHYHENSIVSQMFAAHSDDANVEHHHL